MTRSKSVLRCTKGHEWYASIDNVLKKNGTGCPHCFGRPRLTDEVLRYRLSERGFTVLCENTFTNRKSKLQCSNGHVWEARLGGVLSGGGCPQCNPRRALTVEEVNGRIAPRGYVVSGDFVSAGKMAEFKCASGHKWRALPDNILRGKGCPSCAEYGFNPEYPAQFYTLRIFSDSEHYIGFGITRDIETRMQYHRRAIESRGFKIDDVLIYEFASGHDAIALERTVKNEIPIVDTLIPGFRTEAILACDRDRLRGLVEGATS